MFIEAFGHRAAYQIATIDRKMTEGKRTWNSLLVELFRASVAHCEYLLVKNWATLILEDTMLQAKPGLKKVMKDCFELFGNVPFEFRYILAHGLIDTQTQLAIRWSKTS
jgi:acyl-CoA oxidase